MYQEETTWDPQMGWVSNDMAGQFQTCTLSDPSICWPLTHGPAYIQNEIRSHQPETSQAQSLMSVPISSRS